MRRTGHVVVVLAMIALFAAPSLAQNPPKPLPDARFGNVLFKTPDRAEWRREESGEKLTFAVPVPKGQFCHLEILPGERLEGDFPKAFDKAVAEHLKFLNTRIERDTGNQPSKALEGFDVLQRVIVGKEKKGYTYHWFLAGHPANRMDILVYETSSEALFNQHKQEAANFYYSVKLFNSLGPDAVNRLPEHLRGVKLPKEPPPKPQPARDMPMRDTAPARTSTPADDAADSDEPSGLGEALKSLGKSLPKAEPAAEPKMKPQDSTSLPPLTNTEPKPSDTDAKAQPPATATPVVVRPKDGAAPVNRPPDPKPDAIGPVKTGQTVEALVNGSWQSGSVTYAQELTYFVHIGDGAADRFYQLHELRPVGADKPFADTYHDKTPDPANGPIAIGDTVEANVWNWVPCRVARRVGDMYVVFPEDQNIRKLKPEAWVGPSEMRKVGSQQALSNEALPPQIKPLVAKDIRIGDRVEADMPGGYGWTEATVMAHDNDRFYVANAADSIMRGWVTLDKMRPVGGTNAFEAGK